MSLFGLAPLQLKSKVADSYAAGFTFPHQIHVTRETIVSKIKIYLAGGLAEDLIFGADNASLGRAHDREQVTTLAMDYIRRYGFDPKFQANYALEDAYAMNKFATDRPIEQMIASLVEETNALLKAHEPMLRALSLKLSVAGDLEAAQVSAIAQQHDLVAAVREEGFLYIPAYDQMLLNP
jgi:ATP-dependent Zn protease